MTSSSMIFYGIGMLASYVLGGYLEYKLMVYICLSLTILGVIMLLFLRETPLYLMKKGLDKVRFSLVSLLILLIISLTVVFLHYVGGWVYEIRGSIVSF